jgi:hypothetical protein
MGVGVAVSVPLNCQHILGCDRYQCREAGGWGSSYSESLLTAWLAEVPLLLWSPSPLFLPDRHLLFISAIRRMPWRGPLLLLHVAHCRLPHVLCRRLRGNRHRGIPGYPFWRQAIEGVRMGCSQLNHCLVSYGPSSQYGTGGEFFLFLPSKLG